mgnify:CR=1 FL=1
MTSDGSKKTNWSALLAFFVRDENNQIQLLDYLLEFCKTEGKKFSSLVQYIVQILYDSDVLGEDAILKWYDQATAQKEKRDQADTKLIQQCDKFIQWLKTATEEDDDEEEEEDDEDDE